MMASLQKPIFARSDLTLPLLRRFTIALVGGIALGALLWWTGYALAGHRQTPTQTTVFSWLGWACGLGTYLQARRAGTRYNRVQAVLLAVTYPLTCLLAAYFAWNRGTIVPFKATIYPFFGILVGGQIAEMQTLLPLLLDMDPSGEGNERQ